MSENGKTVLQATFEYMAKKIHGNGFEQAKYIRWQHENY
jgi:hypothetical protein